MPRPTPNVDPRRRRVGRAVALWGGLTLGGVAALGALVIWHLRRRGQLLRERLGPPRVVRWPEGDELRVSED